MNCFTMLRYFFALILVVHGLIHLVGFAKAFRPSMIAELTQHISRPSGLLWLLACLFFLITAILFLLQMKTWWVVAACGLLLSQVLVIMSWSDAKFGTIANILILLPAIVGYGAWKFRSMVANELAILLATDMERTKIITEDMMAPLPTIVREWLKRSNVTGKELIRVVHARQIGEMRTAPSGKWMKVRAEQYNVMRRPGFLWVADVRMAPLLHLAGRDKYANGRGHMLIQLLSLFPIADAKGATIDQGALVRFLAEIVWAPTAALEDYITWEEMEPASAKATIRSGEVTASALFSFSAEGDIRMIEAMRY
ncbi:MAG TPA: DUF6544 family protein, partial [Acidobacteriota bacterium]